MFNAIFGKEKTAKELQRENDRTLRKSSRDIERQRHELEREEKKIEAEIKKYAKEGNQEGCKLLARQLIAVRKQKQRTFAADTKIKGIGYQNKNIGSQIAMSGALASTSQAMGEMNKIFRPEKIGGDLRAFQEANMKMSMTDEMVNETLDDMLTESGDEEESNAIVGQVLDEIGIEISGKIATAPKPMQDTVGEKITATDEDIMKKLEKLRST